MPHYVASSPPVRTAQSASVGADSSTFVRTGNVALSLADLYNSRHAEESACPSSRTTIIPSTSLVDLYNRRHDEQGRKSQPSSISLADLYNQRYESEQHDADDNREISPRQPQNIASRHGPFAVSRPSAQQPYRAISILSSHEGTLEPHRGVEESEEDSDNDIEVDTTPTRGISNRSQARSVSVVTLSDRPEVTYVRRPSVPRRGALGASATRLTIESDDGLDIPEMAEPEQPSASASSDAAPAHPRPPTSKLVVHSSESVSSNLGSGVSTPPIPPFHREGKSGPEHALASTQDQESVNCSVHSALAQREASSNRAAYTPDSDSASPDVRHYVQSDGLVDDVVIISDSSFQEQPRRSTSPGQTHGNNIRASTRSNSEPCNSTENEAVVMLQSPTKLVRENFAQEHDSADASDGRSSPSVHRSSFIRGGVLSEQDIGAVSDADSHTPIIADARIQAVQAPDSSAGATPGDVSGSNGQRSRYPRRARNVTDYNVKRAFERFEQAQNIEEGTLRVQKARKMFLPVEIAPPEFFDVLKSKRSEKTAGGKVPSSFAEFLVAKAKTDSAASRSSASNPPFTRSHEPAIVLTEAQARAILKLCFGPSSMYNVTVSTEDCGSLYQLKPSTRRWLGINGPGPLLFTNDADDDASIFPPSTGTRTPLDFQLGAVISSHLDDEISLPVLREALDSLGAKDLIGRPKDATTLESASRRLRLGHACKLPLPDTLRIFADMEHQEWVRLEEHTAEIELMAEEQRAREQGRIMVEVENNDWVQTQFDGTGKKRFSKLRCYTGGELRMYFDMTQSSPVVPKDCSQGYKIVRTVSPTKFPAASRLSSAQVRYASDVDVEMDTEDADNELETNIADRHAGTSNRAPVPAESATPIVEVNIPTARHVTPLVTPQKLPHHKEAEPASKSTTEIRAPAKPKHQLGSAPVSKIKPLPKNPATSKPTSTTAIGTLDLYSYFTTSASPAQPSAKPQLQSATKSTTATIPTRANGKSCVVDEEIRAWSFSSRTPDSDVEVYVDLKHSAASEGIGRQKHLRSPSPSGVSLYKRKALVTGDKMQAVRAGNSNIDIGDPFLRAEAKRKDIQHRRSIAAQNSVGTPRRRDETTGMVDNLAMDSPVSRGGEISGMVGKRKRKDVSRLLEDKGSDEIGLPDVRVSPPRKVSRQPLERGAKQGFKSPPNPTRNAGRTLPSATPSPSKGGWTGISGWYTSNREAFSPTPIDSHPKMKPQPHVHKR